MIEIGQMGDLENTTNVTAPLRVIGVPIRLDVKFAFDNYLKVTENIPATKI